LKTFDVPAQLAKDGARGVFTFIIPRGVYTNVLDTYQVSMNVPVVHLSYLAREDPSAAATREKRFPELYSSPSGLSRRLLAEMDGARVHYVLFEERSRYDAAKFKGEVLAEQGDAILVRFGDSP
jgi:hypothetical protein